MKLDRMMSLRILVAVGLFALSFIYFHGASDPWVVVYERGFSVQEAAFYLNSTRQMGMVLAFVGLAVLLGSAKLFVPLAAVFLISASDMKSYAADKEYQFSMAVDASDIVAPRGAQFGPWWNRELANDMGKLMYYRMSALVGGVAGDAVGKDVSEELDAKLAEHRKYLEKQNGQFPLKSRKPISDVVTWADAADVHHRESANVPARKVNGLMMTFKRD